MNFSSDSYRHSSARAVHLFHLLDFTDLYYINCVVLLRIFIIIITLLQHSCILAGFWSLQQPDPKAGECVDVTLTEEKQSWELTTCESLLPFMCRARACPSGSFHCSNGNCINDAFRCDKQDDCGDSSDEIDCPSNCNYYLASSGDVVESPYYPQKYAPLTNCKWTLEGPQGHNILLQVNYANNTN